MAQFTGIPAGRQVLLRVAMLFCLLLNEPVVSAIAPPTFFVSPGGDDASAGTKDHPFRTLHHAQTVARQQPVVPPTSVRALIYLRAGVFLGPENIPLRFTADDSCTVWAAYHGEEVLLSGGINVDKALRPHPTLPAVLYANLTELGITHTALGQVGGNESSGTSIDRSGRYGEVGAFAELFYNSQAMQLAQWPNRMPGDIVNYSHTSGAYGTNCKLDGFSCSGNCTGFEMHSVPEPQMQRWAREANERDPWLHGFPVWDFADQYIKLQAVDAANRGLIVGEGYEVCKPGARMTVTNMLSELDAIGEYYIERSNGSRSAAEARGTLFFRRPTGAVPTGDTVSIRGAFVSMTSSVVSFADNTSMITLSGVRLEHSRGSAVAANGASTNITIERCVVANTGASGIEMTDCTGCLVADSEVYGVAGYGINIAGGRHDTLRRGDNTVRNTSIYRYARWHRTNRPGIHWQGVSNTFEFNVIHDSPTQGIMGGGSSAVCGNCHFDAKNNLVCQNRYDFPCGANDNVFQFNHIFNVTRECTDCGQWYSCGQTGAGYTRRGNVFRNNRMEHSRRHTFTPNPGAFGNMQVFSFYLDDTMSGWNIVNNSWFDVDVGILINGGRDNAATSNRFEHVGYPVQLVDECPHGKITVGNLYRGYTELRKTEQWPAWDKYNLSHYFEPSGDLPPRDFFNETFYPQGAPDTFNNWSCTAGGNLFRDNSYCNMSGVFCRGYDVHHCTNTTSVFSHNYESCPSAR